MREKSYRPAVLREIKLFVAPLAMGVTTPELIAAYFDEDPKAQGAATPLCVKLAAARKAQGVVDEPNAALDVQWAGKLLGMKLTTPELLRASIFSTYPADAQDALLKATERKARENKSWHLFHPRDDDSPKSRADQVADILGKPRPADPRAADSDAPPRKMSALEIAMQDDVTAGIITRLRQLADSEYTAEAYQAKSAALTALYARPGGAAVHHELQLEAAGREETANAKADAERHAYLLSQARAGQRDDKPKNRGGDYDQ